MWREGIAGFQQYVKMLCENSVLKAFFSSINHISHKSWSNCFKIILYRPCWRNLSYPKAYMKWCLGVCPKCRECGTSTCWGTWHRRSWRILHKGEISKTKKLFEMQLPNIISVEMAEGRVVSPFVRGAVSRAVPPQPHPGSSSGPLQAGCCSGTSAQLSACQL